MRNMDFEEEADEENLISTSSSERKMHAPVPTISRFSDYSSKVSWYVFALICVFTLGKCLHSFILLSFYFCPNRMFVLCLKKKGSWLDVSGLWCELPFMVDELPEGWRLPSILSAISQFAQLGPFMFLICKLFCAQKIENVKTIYIIFSIGACACFSLALFWNRSVVIFNEKRSIYLYIFNFGLSLLGRFILFLIFI